MPCAQLYIFGAGHVSHSLYKVARIAGFDVTVIDDRDTYANRERFPDARDIYADDYDRVLPQLAPSDSAFMVIVTRGHHDDMRILRWAVNTPCRYIGMIGSERKFLKISAEFEKENIPDIQTKLERIYSPVGLDIGAITPEEIAIAVVAEMIAVRRNSASALPHLAWSRNVKKVEKP